MTLTMADRVAIAEYLRIAASHLRQLTDAVHLRTSEQLDDYLIHHAAQADILARKVETK